MSIIVSDASPLIALARINQLNLLPNLFDETIIPPIVANEVMHSDKPGGQLIQSLPWLIEMPLASNTVLNKISNYLSEGERHAIALANQLECELLIDELSGRKEAQKHGVLVKGTIGLLLKAKDEGLLSAVKPLLEDLIRRGFWLSPRFYEDVLSKAGERG